MIAEEYTNADYQGIKAHARMGSVALELAQARAYELYAG